jgi:dethiobiotin synthetase/adenosylmethionine--8-amino-7-oxononanoate aminotransferase
MRFLNFDDVIINFFVTSKKKAMKLFFQANRASFSLSKQSRQRNLISLNYARRSKCHIGLEVSATGAEIEQQQKHLRSEGVQNLPLRAPIFQIYGSNTDVGKTIVSAGICKSIIEHGKRVGYIKPLQTGTDPDANDGFEGDAAFIHSHALVNCSSSQLFHQPLETSTLFSWKTPVSPHLAAQKEDYQVSDEQLSIRLSEKLEKMLEDKKDIAKDLVLVETAGGVCSPSASMQPQVDVYRNLRLPVVLVGDGKLGGISATYSALDSLLLRGYDVAAIVIIEQDNLDNAEALTPRANELGIPVFAMGAVPPQPEPLHEWYEAHLRTFTQLTSAMEDFHQKRLARFELLQNGAEQLFWWPFTQHKKYGGLSIIDSAHGDEFAVLNRQKKQLEPMFDACASWWTQGIGHGNSKMAIAIAYTAGRYGHVMFPENVHEPAFKLSERLLQTVGKNWASRVYFSDDGSTAVEVALKMAFRKFIVDHGLDYATVKKEKRLVALAQTNCYHGDTLGVMNIAEPSVFNEQQHPWYHPKAVFVKTPSISYRNGVYTIELDQEIQGDYKTLEEQLSYESMDQVFDLSRETSHNELAQVYRDYVRDVMSKTNNTLIGALLIEPVLIGAGGMVLVDPLFQRVLIQEARQKKIPVIYDEVFSGCWRLGVESGRDLLGIDPDIACYAKLLTGGVIPLAVTLATEDVFDTFYGDNKAEALLHGHSFTAHPIGCAAAVTALDMYSIMNENGDKSQLHHSLTKKYWNQNQVQALSRLPHVARTFEIGTVLGVELASKNAGYTSSEAQDLIRHLRQNHVYARALGNVVYMMCSPLTTSEQCDKWMQILQKHLEVSVQTSFS